MAHHEYLELEGGHLMIEFIVRQCALPVSVDEVHSTWMCCHLCCPTWCVCTGAVTEAANCWCRPRHGDKRSVETDVWQRAAAPHQYSRTHRISNVASLCRAPLPSVLTCWMMLQVLWPYLLECLVPPPYTEAMAAVCRSAAHLASKKRDGEDDDYELDYEILGNSCIAWSSSWASWWLLNFFVVNVPKPHAMISRLLACGLCAHSSLLHDWYLA